VAEGNTVELDRVLLVADGKKVTAGNPVIADAKVMATAKESGKSDKIIVFKYKPKVRYRRKNGHRQQYTRLSIDSIMAPGMAKPKPAKAAKPVKKTTRRKKKEETVNGA
jgi:large subunit ribosomal protein L21